MKFWLLLLATRAAFLLYPGPPSAGSGWRPVTAQELKLTSAAIGDPDAEAAILFREGELNDNDPEGTSLKVYIRIKVFNDRGRRYGEVNLPYRVELGKISDVRGRTVKPDGTVIEVDGRDIYDKLVLKTGHSIWRAKVLSLPAVEAGSIIEYRYRQTYPQGFRYFALDLQSDLFIKELQYRIQPHTASQFDVRWVTFGASDPGRFAPVWDGTYNIKAENIPPFRREPLMPPELAVKMWGWLFYSKETETDPDKYWQSYAQRMHDIALDETKPTRAIRRVVESITLSGDHPMQKLARIYQYVQSEIRNLSFTGAQESGGVTDRKQNNSADDTIRRRYGTSREINRLFVAMLRAVGLDARVAELTTRDENLFSRSFPDSFQFNSEVSAVVAPGGSVEFYDPGTPFCPVGMLSWEKEAVQAMVYGRHDARFVETPVTDAARNLEKRNLTVSPHADGRVDVEQELNIGGQHAVILRNEMSEFTAMERQKRAMQSLLEVLPAANINEQSVRVTNVTNAAVPFSIAYNFSVPGFAPRTEKRLLLRPALLSHRDESLLQAPNRSNKIYFHYPWAEADQVVVEVPDGYLPEQLPEPIDFEIGAARYHAGFSYEANHLIYERKLAVNAIIISVDQYSTIKAFFDRVHQADQLAVSLKRIS